MKRTVIHRMVGCWRSAHGTLPKLETALLMRDWWHHWTDAAFVGGSPSFHWDTISQLCNLLSLSLYRHVSTTFWQGQYCPHHFWYTTDVPNTNEDL